jgi:hypothetical protein
MAFKSIHSANSVGRKYNSHIRAAVDYVLGAGPGCTHTLERVYNRSGGAEAARRRVLASERGLAIAAAGARPTAEAGNA